MTREERESALHCLKVMIDEEVCEECKLYGTTGTDHCEADCVRVAIEALECMKKIKTLLAMDNATNGDVIIAMFPHAHFEEYEDECRHIVIMWVDGKASIFRIDFEWDWWNALYKEVEE